MKAEAIRIRLYISAGGMCGLGKRGQMWGYWNWLTPVCHPRGVREQDQVSLVGVNAD